MSTIIIATNVTVIDINLPDLAGQYFGIEIPVTLSDLYSADEIALSNDLITAVNESKIVINNGILDLGIDAALHLLNNNHVLTLTELMDVPDINGEENVSVVYDGTAFIWHEHLTRDSTGIEFALSDHASSDYVSTGTSTWTSIRTFIYSGTNVWTPLNFFVIGSLSKFGATASARLVDYTNNQVICEVSWSTLNKEINFSNTINNLPSSPVILELQVMTSKTGTEARTHYMSMY